jgi:hypothetical protein
METTTEAIEKGIEIFVAGLDRELSSDEILCCGSPLRPLLGSRFGRELAAALLRSVVKTIAAGDADLMIAGIMASRHEECGRFWGVDAKGLKSWDARPAPLD